MVTTMLVPSRKKDVQKLTMKQDIFCKLYATDPYIFGNAKECYIKAYNSNEVTARSQASKFLELPHITARINEYLQMDGFNNENVDKQLLFVINQHKDLSTKVKGIQEYNKLKKRVTDRLEITIPKPIIDMDDEESNIKKIEKKRAIDVQYEDSVS